MVVRADNLRMGETACQASGKALNGKGEGPSACKAIW
jgi:hypothetical protein